MSFNFKPANPHNFVSNNWQPENKVVQDEEFEMESSFLCQKPVIIKSYIFNPIYLNCMAEILLQYVSKACIFSIRLLSPAPFATSYVIPANARAERSYPPK